MKKKILFFLPGTVGGSERMTVTIAKMLPKERFDAKFVIVGRETGPIVQFIPDGYDIIHIPVHNIWCAATLRMMGVIRREKPDSVFASIIYLNGRLILAAKLCGVNVMVRNNIGISRYMDPVSLFFLRHVYKFADTVVAQQEEMREELMSFGHIPQDRVITMHNPLDIETITAKASVASPFSVSETGIKYVQVARFSEEKGQDLAVRAIKRLVDEGVDAHLHLIGRYDRAREYDRSIKDYVEENGLEGRVHFEGEDNNPYRWMKHSDCYVMTSRREGLPNALIEAMFLGTPVVATKCIPVVERIVNDGNNGYLVPPDDLDALVNGMRMAVSLAGCQMTYKPTDVEDVIRLFS